MKLRVTQYGEPILREKGQPVQSFDPEIAELADDMVETMYAADGIGLAAQQVGRAIQLCVVDVNVDEGPPAFRYALDGKTPPLDLIMPLALINPRVEPLPDPREDYEEGCLSFPDIRGIINRPAAVRVDYHDTAGSPHTLTADGLLARVIQHEVDHLNGVLFIDRMTPAERKKVDAAVKQLKRQTRDRLKANR